MTKARIRRFALLLPAATMVLVLGSCQTQSEPLRSAYPELAAAMRDLEAAQRGFEAATQLPQRFDFEGHGRVQLTDLALDGYPGNTYVRARWHYQNTTGKPVICAHVGLDVLDADGNVVARKVSVCIFPTPRLLHDGTYFADELRTQTHGVHNHAGWSWRITCRAEFFDEDEAYQPVGEGIR